LKQSLLGHIIIIIIMDYLFLFSIITAALHFIQALLVRALSATISQTKTTPFGGVQFSVVKQVIGYDQNTSSISFVTKDEGYYDVVNLIVCFFFLSAMFQSAAVSLDWRWLRFVEYSFSASIMLVCIALEAGVRDLYTLRCMAVLMWITQLLGLMAEFISHLSLRVREGIEWHWVFPHTAAWVTCLAAYAPAIDAFIENQDKAPDFVRWMVYLELLLFMSFGAVQLYGLARKSMMESVIVYVECHSHGHLVEGADAAGLDSIDTTCEYAYTTLSFVAKTLLAWIVLSPILAAR
jgi:hypothetical protein